MNIKDIKEFKTSRARKAGFFPAIWNAINQTHPEQEEYHGVSLKVSFIYHDKNGKLHQAFPLKSWNNGEDIIKQKLISEKNYLRRLHNKQRKLGDNLVKLAENIRQEPLEERGADKLLSKLGKLRSSWLEYDRVNVFPWYLGADKLYDYLYKKLEGLGVDKGKIDNLLTPNELSFSAKEELGIYKLALNIQADKDASSLVQKLVEDYYWIPVGYDNKQGTYDEKHFISEARELLEENSIDEIKNKIHSLERKPEQMKKEQERIYDQYDVSNGLKEIIQRMHTLNKMTDERKEFTFPSHLTIDIILDSLAVEMNVKKEDLKYLTLEEMKKYKNQDIKELANSRRENDFIAEIRDGEVLNIVVNDQEVESIKEEIFSSEYHSNRLEGTTGAKGEKVSGIARVLSSPAENSKVKEGEILVTAMTTPEYVPAMRKAAAIVTDEGGITSHAAIVSREMKKPCVIGTKHATQVLEDGDEVEVDAEEGIVKIVNEDS